MKLSRLHEEFIDAARRPMDFGRLPVMPRGRDVPVIATDKWKKSDNSLIKTYSFISNELRNDFVRQLLIHEENVGHHATMTVQYEIVGEASNGKTAIALKTIAANQKRDPNFTTVWIAAEQWVPAYAEMCGVDVSRIYVVSTNVMEEAYSVAINLVETKEVDCVVIDSLPALVPTTEEEKIFYLVFSSTTALAHQL